MAAEVRARRSALSYAAASFSGGSPERSCRCTSASARVTSASVTMPGAVSAHWLSRSAVRSWPPASRSRVGRSSRSRAASSRSFVPPALGSLANRGPWWSMRAPGPDAYLQSVPRQRRTPTTNPASPPPPRARAAREVGPRCWTGSSKSGKDRFGQFGIRKNPQRWRGLRRGGLRLRASPAAQLHACRVEPLSYIRDNNMSTPSESCSP